MNIIENFINFMMTSTRGTQIAKSFDDATIKKIIKGAFWSFIDAGVFAILAYFGNIEMTDPILTEIVIASSIFLTNSYKEWRKGE